ncbi:CHAT domain-containing protein [Solwaraspora sp. WMMB335]|uniref:CHAT domain-containing protein n=1 Tax=Solwaraspora sp. WMMB335 TaxID=3404118 RepID=UPI003B93978F
MSDVVETLRRRLEWHETSPESARVLDAEVLSWGAEILLALGPPEERLGPETSDDVLLAFWVAGTLHLYRAQSMPSGLDEQDFSAAFAILALLLPHHRHVLPDDLREATAGCDWSGPADGPNAWVEAGAVHLLAAEQQPDATGLEQAVKLFEQAERVASAGHPARILVDINLSHALLRPHTPRGPATLLVVSAPAAPGLTPLPAASREARALSRTVARTRVLEDRHAKPADVLRAIPGHTCVHFACHAGWTGGDPFGAPRLALTTGDITPLDLAALRLDGADLAYLSACDTTVGLADAADEGLHIAGAVQLAGFHQVISTLWTVEDDAAAGLAQNVYACMTGPGRNLQPTRAPEALHHAVRELRGRLPQAAETWAAYLHLGGFTPAPATEPAPAPAPAGPA